MKIDTQFIRIICELDEKTFIFIIIYVFSLVCYTLKFTNIYFENNHLSKRHLVKKNVHFYYVLKN